MPMRDWTSKLDRRVDFVAMSPRERHIYATLSRWNWGIAAILLLAVFLTASASRLKLSDDVVPLLPVIVAAFGLLSLFYAYIRKDAFVFILSNTIALVAAQNYVWALFSYTAQFWGASLPLHDELFARLDAALGADWVTWFVWLNNHPLLAIVLRHAYTSAGIQTLILVFIAQFVFSWEIRLQRALLAAQVSAVVTLVVAAAVPALGAYHHFEGRLNTLIQHRQFSPEVTDVHVAYVLNLRGHAPELRLDHVYGIITFPSFHTVLAILFIWAVWPNRPMRWVALAVNGLMILAAPLFGAHYLVDVFAGGCVAIVAIGVSNSVTRHVEKTQPSPTSVLPASAVAGLGEQAPVQSGQTS
jgi:PAP2 superfamily